MYHAVAKSTDSQVSDGIARKAIPLSVHKMTARIARTKAIVLSRSVRGGAATVVGWDGEDMRSSIARVDNRFFDSTILGRRLKGARSTEHGDESVTYDVAAPVVVVHRGVV